MGSSPRGQSATRHGFLRRSTIALGAALVLGAAVPAVSGPPEGHPRIDGNLRDAAGMVEVEIQGRNGTSPLAALAGHGAFSTIAVGDVVFATVPAAALPAIADHPLVRWVRPASRPLADAVTGQGVAVTNAGGWHAVGVTGAGIDIAVVDAGFAGYQALQNSGDLPLSIDTENYCGSPAAFQGDPHGSAVAEIVHEMAPGAALHLICVNTGGDLAMAVDYAAANGIDVISESLSWYPPGRGDGTGFLEPVIAAANSAGIVWVNSAGNQGRSHWGGTFTDIDLDGWHDFSGTNDAGEENTFTLATGEFVFVVLRWDDWPDSNNDYAVHLYRASDDLLLETSAAQPQTGTQEPLDWFDYTSPANQTVYVKVEKVSATATPEMDLFVTLSGGDLETFTPARSLTDPGTSPLVFAAGATEWDSGSIQSYSSRGPTIAGMLKPDISGPDEVNSATYGTFAGTSASAPHVAGAFALLLDAAPCLGITGSKSLLASLAEDRGSPGQDNSYGAGLLHLGNPQTVADTTGCVLRYSGVNRFETAAAIAEADFPDPVETVFIATGFNFPDGLAGAAVAARMGSPLLLVDGGIPAATAAQLTRLDPERIVVLGGPQVVSERVASELSGYAPEVDRVFGNDRYGTAVAISQYGFPDTPVTTVFVATGANFPDALTAGAAAAQLDGAVLLVPGGTLPQVVADEILRLAPSTIVVVGGTSAVTSGVFDALSALQPGDSVLRISGDDRFATAVAISEFAFSGGSPAAYIATGFNFPDALAGAAAAGSAGSPVLLVPGGSLPPVVGEEIDRLGVEMMFVLGGISAVTAIVERVLEDGLG